MNTYGYTLLVILIIGMCIRAYTYADSDEPGLVIVVIAGRIIQIALLILACTT